MNTPKQESASEEMSALATALEAKHARLLKERRSLDVSLAAVEKNIQCFGEESGWVRQKRRVEKLMQSADTAIRIFEDRVINLTSDESLNRPIEQIKKEIRDLLA